MPTKTDEKNMMELPLLSGHRRSVSDEGSPTKSHQLETPPKIVVVSPTKKKSRIFHRNTPMSETVDTSSDVINQPPMSAKSKTKTFALPLLSSTPLNQSLKHSGIFHHKRRSSAGGESAKDKSHKHSHKASLATPTSESMGLFQRLTSGKNEQKTTTQALDEMEKSIGETDEILENAQNDVNETSKLGILETVDELSAIPESSDVQERTVENNIKWTPQEELSLITAPTSPMVDSWFLPGSASRSVHFSQGALTPSALESVFARLDQGEEIYDGNHHFLAEDKDLHSMERSLLNLLQDFRSGKLNALRDDTMEEMRTVRQQQEKLAKLHFELYAEEKDFLHPNIAKAGDLQADVEIPDTKFKRLSEGLKDLQNSIQYLCATEELS